MHFRTRRWVPVFSLLVLLISILVLAGCDDEVCPVEETGLIRVTINPDPLAALWRLQLPGGSFIEGETDSTMAFMPLGEYSITWGEVDGWVLADSGETILELEADKAVHFTCEYAADESHTASVNVEMTPEGIDAPWVLNGPDGYTMDDGQGPMELSGLEVGSYTITWGEVTNWTAPASETLTVGENETITFVGVYEIGLPMPLSPEILMANFVTVNENMFIEGFESILHEDHRTVILQSTFEEWAGSDNPLNFPYFDRYHIGVIHENIFGGSNGTGPNGNPLPAISSISFSSLERLAVWEQVPASVPYFGGFSGCYRAPYMVLAHFNQSDGARFEVGQMIEFIVTEDGEGMWSLLGIIPYENADIVSTEGLSYDALLSLYR